MRDMWLLIFRFINIYMFHLVVNLTMCIEGQLNVIIKLLSNFFVKIIC